MSRPFEILWELEPVTRPDRSAVAGRIATGAAITDRFLVPDNPTARAAVSSLTVAREVRRAGGEPTACLNARDRNLLGLRRDLLTAAWHGVDDLLFVHGDDPSVGERTGGLTVRAMVGECRGLLPGARIGLTTRIGPLAAWKRDADRLLVQVSWSLDDLLRWQDGLDYDGDVLPAVLVVPSAAMARRLSERLPELRVPDALVDAVDRDGHAGVDWACHFIADLADSGAFAGVHLIAGVRGPEVAARLTAMGRAPALTRRPTRPVRPALAPLPDPAA